MIVVVRNNPAKSINPKEATSQFAPPRMLSVTEVKENRKGIRTGKPRTTVRDEEPLALNDNAERKVSAVPRPTLPKKMAKNRRSKEVRDQIFEPKKSENNTIERRLRTKMSRA